MTIVNKAISEISVDTRLLYQRIRELKPDEVIEYAELSKLIGRDVTSRARTNLISARRIAERDDKVVTSPVMRIGIKRLNPAATLTAGGEDTRRRMRRMAARGDRKLATIDFLELTPAQRILHNAERSQLGALKAFAGDKITKRIETKVSDVGQEQLALAKTLQAFEK